MNNLELEQQMMRDRMLAEKNNPKPEPVTRKKKKHRARLDLLDKAMSKTEKVAINQAVYKVRRRIVARSMLECACTYEEVSLQIGISVEKIREWSRSGMPILD